MREKTLETKIKTLIKAEGGWCVKFFANAYTQKGVPDILACVNGYFLAVEVKADKGRVSPLQLRTIEELKKAGGTALVVKPKDLEDLKKIISFLKNS